MRRPCECEVISKCYKHALISGEKIDVIAFHAVRNCLILKIRFKWYGNLPILIWICYNIRSFCAVFKSTAKFATWLGTHPTTHPNCLQMILPFLILLLTLAGRFAIASNAAGSCFDWSIVPNSANVAATCLEQDGITQLNSVIELSQCTGNQNGAIGCQAKLVLFSFCPNESKPYTNIWPLI